MMCQIPGIKKGSCSPLSYFLGLANSGARSLDSWMEGTPVLPEPSTLQTPT